jgi:phosphatidylserine/phosphatidylglycerophosphate/cardiolipin synthase-like enzyme
MPRSRKRRRSGRRTSSRFSAVLVIAVLLAGGYAYLKQHGDLPTISVPSRSPSAPGGGAGASAPPLAGSGHDQAFVFSTTGGQPQIYGVIDSATKSLEMTMYELSDTTAVNDLIARHRAGVNVRVVLDQAEKSGNQAAFTALQNAGVGVVWSSTTFAYTHQKTISVDDRESVILSGNLTQQYYATGRDYGVVDTDPHDVAAIVAVFDNDYAHTATTPADADDLLWSPTTAQSRVLDVIDHATKTLDVEGEEFSDGSVVDAIVARAKAGVQVRVMVESPAQYRSEIAKVVAAGGKVVGYSSSTGLYIHAKTVVADAGLPDQTAEIGSMNFTTASLHRNRELGIILTDPAVCHLVTAQFGQDFAGGAPQS